MSVFDALGYLGFALVGLAFVFQLWWDRKVRREYERERSRWP